MVQKIRIARLRNPELLQFTRHLLDIVQKLDPEKLKVVDQSTALKNTLAAAERAFKKENSSALTDVLVELDEKRDKLLVGISSCVDGFTNHFDEETRAAAQLLKDHLASFGTSIVRENYMRESALITKLVSDWRTRPELKKAMTALNLTLWLKNLSDMNELFNTRYLERNREMGNVTADAFREKKEELIIAYEKLIARLNSYYDIMEGVEPFATAANDVNELNEKYQLLMVGRKRGEPEEPKPVVAPAK